MGGNEKKNNLLPSQTENNSVIEKVAQDFFFLKQNFWRTEKGFENSFTGLKLVWSWKGTKGFTGNLKALLELTGLGIGMWRGIKNFEINLYYFLLKM